MPEDKIFWVGQKAIINKDGEVLVLNDPFEGLDFPGGKIQEGETDLAKSLQREVREESNLEIIVGDPFVVWYNKFPEGHKYAGKTVYLIAFKCRYVSGEIKLSNEHDQFKWVNKDNYRELDTKDQYFAVLEKYFSL